MKIGIIGAGKMGCALATALKREGFDLKGIYSKSVESSRYLNAMLKTNFQNSLEPTIRECDVVFISTADSFIGSVAQEIENRVDSSCICGKIFMHLSGALDSRILDPIKRQGGYTCSLHPLQTFADKDTGWKGLYNIYFGFEGSSIALKAAKDIATKLGSTIIFIDSNKKALYHAAASIISNYTVTLAHTAGRLFKLAGVQPEYAETALLPLLEKTVQNIRELGSINALTGPVARGDYMTVSNHIEILKKESPEIESVYKLLGLSALEIALGRGTLEEESAEKLKEILESYRV